MVIGYPHKKMATSLNYRNPLVGTKIKCFIICGVWQILGHEVFIIIDKKGQIFIRVGVENKIKKMHDDLEHTIIPGANYNQNKSYW